MAQSAREIDAQAADWAARVDRGPLDQADAAALEAWLAGDSRRLGAYGRVRGIALHTERARALDGGDDVAPTRRMDRRAWLAGGAGVAASIAGAAFLANGAFTRRSVTTHKGEVRVVALEDGSVVTLDTSTRLTVHMTPHRRELALQAGEALFEVAHDPARPFVVAAGDVRVTAIGTAFAVRRELGRPTRVLVQKGVVRLDAPGGSAPLRLAAGMGVEAGSGTHAGSTTPEDRPVEVGAAEIGRRLAWREGRLAFSGQTLSQAAAEFRRYSDTRIVIADPALAGEQVIGLFDANDPVGFSRAVAASLGARATVDRGEVRLLR